MMWESVRSVTLEEARRKNEDKEERKLECLTHVVKLQEGEGLYVGGS